MPNDAKRSVPIRLDSLAEVLAERHESEAAVLDVLIGALARGQSNPELWALMHAAARRDDRLSELALAYEGALGDKKVRLLAAAAQVELQLAAARFFADDFADVEGAVPHLERVIALAPANVEAFERLETYLVERREARRLGELYASVAQFRERPDQLRLLRRALQIVSGLPGEDDRALKLGREILRLDPGDRATRSVLETKLVRAGRAGEAAKLLEQAVTEFADSDPDEVLSLRTRLLGIYGGVSELEKGLPHAEEILRFDPTNESAREALEPLLANKALAARAAAALESAYDRTGQVEDAVRMLGLEVEALRGPKRLEAQKRLLALLADRLDDAEGAFTVCEAVVPIDPADEAVRARLRDLAVRLGKPLDAARVVQRANLVCRDPALRARLGAELGELYLEGGDAKKARLSLVAVIDAAADPAAVLRASRAMAVLCAREQDVRGLASVLQRLSEIDDDPAQRAEATVRLAAICEGELADPAGAIAAYRRLFDTAYEEEAIAALERLLEGSDDPIALAEILERKAQRTTDPVAARELAVRAAEARTAGADDAVALATWRALVERFGPSREVVAKLAPLLERAGRWADLAALLAADVELAPEGDRAALYARLGSIQLEKLGEPLAAVRSFGHALDRDAHEKGSLRALVALLDADPEVAAAAADVLEPVLRAERARGRGDSAGLTKGLVRVLVARAGAAAPVRSRLDAIGEAASLTAGELGDPSGALDLAGRGLVEALRASALDALGPWLVRVDAFSVVAAEPARRAALLLEALGDRPIDHPAIVALARRAAEALAAHGREVDAIGVYRRLLAADSRAADLVEKIDALLRTHGTPAERAEVLRAALANETDRDARKALGTKLATLQRDELGDVAGAIATYRLRLQDDPTDAEAREALLDAHAAAGAFDELFDELARGLASEVGDGRARLLCRMAEAAAAGKRFDDAARCYGEAFAEPGVVLPEPVLEAAERVASELGNAELERSVLERRAALATDEASEIGSLERLGLLEATRLGEVEAGVGTWKRAAMIAARAGRDADARRLHERVLGVRPDDADSAEYLVAAYRASGTPAELFRAYEALSRARAGTPLVVDAVLALSAIEGAFPTDRALAAIDAAIAAGGLDDDGRGALLAARARVLSAEPGREEEAASAFRALVTASAGGEAAESAFEAFLDRDPRAPARVDDRRWLHRLRVERARPEERVARLLASAESEERVLGDLDAASRLLAEVLASEPEHDGALAARSRVLLALGDAEGALAVLEARRDRAEGPARVSLSLEIARLSLDPLGRIDEALGALEAAMATSPLDPAAVALAEHALGLPAARARAAALVERAADEAADPASARRLLRALLADASASPDDRRRWLERLVDLAGDDPEAALEAALAALRELPGEPSLWDRAEGLAREIERPLAVASAYRAAIEAGGAGVADDAFEELGQRAVAFHEEWLDEPETVATLLRRVLGRCPHASWAFDRLKLFYNAAERWSELFGLYDEVIAASPEAERVPLLEDAAETARDLAGDVDRAIGYLEGLLGYAREPRVAASLERLYERTGRHRALVALLSHDLPSLAREPAQKLRLRIAGLWLEAGDAASACGVLGDALSLEPARAEAPELLERALAIAVAGDDAARLRAAALLATRYRADGRTTDLARVVESALEVERDASSRAALLAELRDLRVALGDATGALGPASELAALEPSVDGHLEVLERLAAGVGHLDVFADTIVRIAEARHDAGERAGLYARAAALFEGPLADVTKAAELRRRVLDLSPDVAEVLHSARVLERLLESLGRDVERCDVLERIATLATDAAERRAVLAEVARVATAGGDDARAIRAWRARVDAAPEDREAQDGLVEALTRLDRHEDLAAALARRAEFAPDVGAARRDRAAVARLLAGPLGRATEAIEAWQRLRDDLGPDDESCDALAELLEAAGRADELAAILDGALATATSAARRVALARRLGDTHRLQTRDFELAVLAYGVALADDPRDDGALAGLGAIVDALTRASRPGSCPPLLAGAVDALVGVLRATDSWQGTLRLLEPRVLVAADDAARVALLLEAADLFERRAADPARAFEPVWRAFRLAPSSPAAAELLRLAPAAGRLGDVADGLVQAIEGREGPPAPIARDLFAAVGAHLCDERGDLAGAEAAYVRALAHAPADEALLTALAQLQRRAPSRALVDTLLRLSEARGGDLALEREAAEVARDHVADAALAARIAEGALARAAALWETPEGARVAADLHDVCAWAIELLLALAGEGVGEEAARERRIALHLRGAALPFDADRRRAMRLAAAELADGEHATELYRELFDERPEDAIVAERLEALYRGAGRSRDLRAVRERQIGLAKGAERARLRLDVAEIEASLGDRATAASLLEASLGEHPEHEPTAARLATLLDELGRDVELVTLLEQRATLAERAGDVPRAASGFEQAGLLALERLKAADRALLSLERAAGLGSDVALDAVARLRAERGDHAGAAEALERLCDRAAPALVASALPRLFGELVDADRHADARARLDAALAAGVPGGDDLRACLLGLFRGASAWGPLADLLAAEAAVVTEPEAKLARLREAAELHLVQREDPAAAVPLLRAAVEVAPTDRAVALSLAQALSAIGEPAAAADVLRGILATYGARRPKDRARFHHELARALLAAGDRSGALAELDLCLRIDPAYAAALIAQARLAVDDGQTERAQRTLRALLLVVKTAGADAGVTRAEVLCELGYVSELSGDAARADEHLESALEAARAEPAEWPSVLRALRDRKRDAALARALAARVQATAGLAPDALAALFAELAALEERLGRADAAFAAALSAIDAAPGSAAAHRLAASLAERFGRAADHDAAIAAVVTRLEAAPDGASALLALARRLGEIGRPDDEVIDVLRRAERRAADGGGDAASIRRALQEIFARRGDSAAGDALLESALAAFAPDATGPAVVDAALALAAHRLAQPSGLDAGATLLDRALRAGAPADRVEALARKALELDRKHAAMADVLVRVGRASGAGRALLDGLWARAEALSASVGDASDARSAAIEALREAAELAAAEGDVDVVERAASRALDVSVGPEGDEVDGPELAWALTGLARVRERAGDRSEASRLWERASRVAPSAERRALLSSAASRAEEPPRAAALLEELVLDDAADPVTWNALVGALGVLPDAEVIARSAANVLAATPTPEERAERARVLGRVLAAKDVARAAALLEAELVEGPEGDGVAADLLDTLEAAGRDEDLARVLGVRAGALARRGDTAATAAIGLRLGAAFERLGRLEAALGAYRGVLAVDPASLDAERAELRLGAVQRDPTEVVARWIAAGRADEAPSVLLELSQARAAAGDEGAAEAALVHGVELFPGDVALRSALAARFEARGDARALAGLHVAAATAALALDERVASLRAAASVLRDRAGDVPGAVELLLEAHACLPDDRELLDALVEACGAAGDHHRAIAAVSAALSRSPGDAALFRLRASLHDAVGDEDAAIDDVARANEASHGEHVVELVAMFEHALEVHVAHPHGPVTMRPTPARTRSSAPPPPSEEGAPSSVALPPERSAPVPPVAALDSDEITATGVRPMPTRPEPARGGASLVAGVSAPSRQRTLRLRFVEVLARSGDTDRARSQLATLLHADPSDPGALVVAAALDEQARRWEAALGHYRRLLGVVGGEVLADVALKLADAAERAGRPDEGRAGLARALAFGSPRPAIGLRLRALADASSDATADGVPSLESAERFASLVQAGRSALAATDEEERERAIAPLEEAARMRPEDDDVAALLGAAYLAADRRADAQELAGRVLEGRADQRSRALASLHRLRARVALDAGAEEAGLAVLAAAFACDPYDPALALELGELALALGEDATARRALEAAAYPGAALGGAPDEHGPVRARALHRLASIAVEAGDRARARALLERAVACDPSYDDARAALAAHAAG